MPGAQASRKVRAAGAAPELPAESSHAASLRRASELSPRTTPRFEGPRPPRRGSVHEVDPWAAQRLLGTAAERGDVRLVERLLDAGFDPNPLGAGCSPLRRAVAHDRAGVVAVLLRHGARFGRRPDERLGILGWAVTHQAHACLPILLEHDRSRGRRRAANAILATCANPGFMRVLDTGCGSLPEASERMLWEAARIGDAPAVELFAGAGVPWRRRYRLRWPEPALTGTAVSARLEADALQVAALGGHVKVIAVLRATVAGADLERPAFLWPHAGHAPWSLSPLGLAVSRGQGHVAWALLEAGADGPRALHTGDGWVEAAEVALRTNQLHLRRLLSQFERLRRARLSPPRARPRWCGLVLGRADDGHHLAVLRREVEALAEPYRGEVGPAPSLAREPAAPPAKRPLGHPSPRPPNGATRPRQAPSMDGRKPAPYLPGGLDASPRRGRSR